MDFLAGVFDFVAAVVASRRGLFWLLMAFIVIGLIAVAANLAQPGRQAFRYNGFAYVPGQRQQPPLLEQSIRVALVDGGGWSAVAGCGMAMKGYWPALH